MKKFIFLLALISFNVFAHDYKCFSYYWNGYENEKGTMLLSVDQNFADADIVEESWDKKIGGALNPKYKSEGKIKFIKYGHDLILEDVLINGGKILNDGSLGGIARVEGQGEGGFYQYKFICKRSW